MAGDALEPTTMQGSEAVRIQAEADVKQAIKEFHDYERGLKYATEPHVPLGRHERGNEAQVWRHHRR